MIRSARREAPLKDSIFACRSALEWAGAAHRYPAALNGRDEENAFATLADLCFKASGEEYERSGACQDVVGRD
jgi:hypothetical protein